MAGLICVALTAEVALEVDTAKTILQIVAPANQRLKLKSWGVFFDGVNGSAEPVEVRLLRQTDAGTMSSLTPIKQVAGSETIQTTAQHTATVEPTEGDLIDGAEVHPQSGYEKLIPFDMPVEIPGGTRIGIECTAGEAVNVKGKMIFEE